MQKQNSDVKEEKTRFSRMKFFLKEFIPEKKDIALSIISSLLLLFAFPDFNFWFLAWCAFVPLLIAVSRNSSSHKKAFFLGWIFGSIFFFGSCYWLTYAMINYGKIPTVIAYGMLLPASCFMGTFAGTFSLTLHYSIKRFGLKLLFVAPFAWIALEWLRLQITGHLWNAVGYSQAFVPQLIQTAWIGGVYSVSFLIVLVNTAIAYAVIEKKKDAFITSFVLLFVCALIIGWTTWLGLAQRIDPPHTEAVVIALQPNVPMDSLSVEDMKDLFNRHVVLSETALKEFEESLGGKNFNDTNINTPRLVIFPESPMLFTYSRDTKLREDLAEFTKRNRVSLIINSLEPAPNDGDANSALLINEKGELAARYDKIYLMPFGEYVPVPRWIPGAKYIPSMVGDFTAGEDYKLFPVGNLKAGIFICFESAFPQHTRKFTNEGADLLIEITNDGYLGPTPVLKQHLANAVFRAVETNRPVVRVTNAGITAFITKHGEVKDATNAFEVTRRTWSVYKTNGQTFYTRYGDVFAVGCLLITVLCLIVSFLKIRRQVTN